MSEHVLRVRNVSKVFANTVALSHVSLDVNPGEIHGLLGENGAGKSTLIKILAGVHSPDAGEIIVDGKELPRGHHPDQARAVGLAFIHQDYGLVGSMSVAENIALVDGFPCRWKAIDWRATRDAARRILEPLGVDLPPRRLVEELPVGYRAIVAIARAVASHAKVLILDEPTASLAAAEVSALFRVIRGLRAAGVASVFVSHRMDEVTGLCDRATVLRNGHKVSTVKLSDVSRAELVEMIIGREVITSERGRREGVGPATLEVEQLEAGVLKSVSFTAHRGEIFGLTGLAGCGAADAGGAVIGRVPIDSGTLTINGTAFRPRAARSAYRAGIAYVPANRADEGLFLSLSLRENLNPNPGSDIVGLGDEQPSRPRHASGRVMRARSEAAEAEAVLRRYDVRPPESDREASTLSGGNAQKLMLARWLHRRPGILILNEPTTGIDIGARHEIYTFLREAAAAGTTCLVVSSDFDEISEVCSRALVLYRGRVAAELAGDELTTGAIATAALGE